MMTQTIRSNPTVEGGLATTNILVASASPRGGEVLAAALPQGGFAGHCVFARTLAELQAALERGGWSAVLADGDCADPDPAAVLAAVQACRCLAPVVVAGTENPIPDSTARALLEAGASDIVQPAHLDRLALALERELRRGSGGVQAAALAAFASALRSTTSREAMLPVILQQTRQLIGVEGAALLRRGEGGDTLEVEAAADWLATPGSRWPADQGLASEALRTGRPRQGALAPGQPEWTALGDMLGLRAAGFAPLVAQGRTIGAVGVAARAPISNERLDLLDAIADMIASALHRAALHEETELRLRRLAALHAVDLAITTSFDLRVTLGIALDHLVGQTQVDAAAVLLLNGPANTLDYAAARGHHTAVLRQAPMRASQPPAGRVIAQRQPVAITNLAAEGPALPPALAGYASYYGVPLIAKGRIHGVLELVSRAPLKTSSDWVEFVASMATQAAIAIDNATLFADLQRTNAELNLAYDATIEGWARVLETRGVESPGHTRRVAELAARAGRAAGLSDVELLHLRRGALLHDIGMLGVPEAVMLKPGPLNVEERAQVQQHPEYGFDMLAPINHLRVALDIPYCHHERWDGAGYPRGLKGEQIPLAARLFSVADVWDALRSDRPFRRAWPEARARDYLREKAGTRFDPHAVNLFFQTLNGSHGQW
jgi:HD-GYP domain-containing protein (c-di-GMP phosphodiesterase class II)